MSFALLETISAAIMLGFLIWFAHISIMLFTNLQANTKSTSQALGLWIKALITTIFVLIIIVY